MNTRPILKNKLYLYLTEFFSGVSVMAVELGASSLLAPYFSSSQIVWTIIIGTIMIAMALGNLWGGRMADKDPNTDKLYRRLLIAAVWIAAIPALGKYIILGISGVLVLTVSTNFLIIAAFCACMVIFVYPLFLLGTVTPSLVKYTVDSLDDSGKTVGTLGAFNTIGSILGTFLPTFVTIPAVGTAVTFLLFSGVLLAIAFMLLYRLPEGFLIKLCQPFLVHSTEQGGLGLSTEMVGTVYGVFGVIALLLGGILGGIVAGKDGLKKWLWPMVCAITLPDIVYVFMAYALPADLLIVNVCVFIEQFGYGFGFTAYMLYLIYYSRGEYKTSHYALCTAFMALSMMIPGLFAGALQEAVGYRMFFIIVMAFCSVTFLMASLLKIDPSFGCKGKQDSTEK